MDDNGEPHDEPAQSDVAVDDVAATRIARLQQTAKARAEAATAWADELRERSVIVEAGFVIYERDRVAAGTVLGSAIAFRLFLFFVPAVLFGVGLLGVFSGYTSSKSLNKSVGITGAVAEQVRTALQQSQSASYITLLTGLFLMLSAGRSLAKALVASSSLAWLTGGRVTAKVKVIALITGLMSSMMLVSLVANRIRAALGIAGAGLSFGVSFFLYLVLFVLLMASLPRRTPDPGAILPGAALTSLVIVGLQSFSQIYLPSRLSGASQLYGSIGIAVVTLGWLFIFGRTLSLAFSVNAALFDRFGSLSQGIFALPALRVLPQRSAGVRRYFGLDSAGRSVETSEPIIEDAGDGTGAEMLVAIESLGELDDQEVRHE